MTWVRKEDELFPDYDGLSVSESMRRGRIYELVREKEDELKASIVRARDRRQRINEDAANNRILRTPAPRAGPPRARPAPVRRRAPVRRVVPEPQVMGPVAMPAVERRAWAEWKKLPHNRHIKQTIRDGTFNKF